MQRYKEINLFNPLINEYTHSKFPITHIYIHIFVLTSPLFHFLHLTIEGNNRSNRILIDPPRDRGLATPCSRSRTRQPTRRRKNNERGRERRSGVDGGSHVYRRAKGKSQTTLAGFQEGRRWLQIPRRQPRRTLFDSLFETAAPAFTDRSASQRETYPFVILPFLRTRIYFIYIYIEASFCSRTRSFQNICALGNGCIRVCSVMCNQSVYTHCVTGHVDIKPEGTKTIRFLLRLHW